MIRLCFIFFHIYIAIGIVIGFLIAYFNKKNRLSDEEEIKEFAEVMLESVFIWPFAIIALMIKSVWAMIKLFVKL